MQEDKGIHITSRDFPNGVSYFKKKKVKGGVVQLDEGFGS